MQLCAPVTATEGVLYVNGTARAKEPLTLVQGPNAAGLALFDGTTTIRLAQGTYALQAGVFVNGTETTRTAILSVQAGTVTAPQTTPAPVPTLPAPFCKGTIAQAVKHLAKTDQIVVTCDGRVSVTKGTRVEVRKP